MEAMAVAEIIQRGTRRRRKRAEDLSALKGAGKGTEKGRLRKSNQGATQRTGKNGLEQASQPPRFTQITRGFCKNIVRLGWSTRFPLSSWVMRMVPVCRPCLEKQVCRRSQGVDFLGG